VRRINEFLRRVLETAQQASERNPANTRGDRAERRHAATWSKDLLGGRINTNATESGSDRAFWIGGRRR